MNCSRLPLTKPGLYPQAYPSNKYPLVRIGTWCTNLVYLKDYINSILLKKLYFFHNISDTLANPILRSVHLIEKKIGERKRIFVLSVKVKIEGSRVDKSG